jgi:hypothetical protein
MKWNEVTWYSRLGAIILFVGVLPVLIFYIGVVYERVQNPNPLPVYTTNVITRTKNVDVPYRPSRSHSSASIGSYVVVVDCDDLNPENITVLKAGKIIQELDPYAMVTGTKSCTAPISQDINFDGYTDFLLLTGTGSAGPAVSYWLYEPTKQEFICPNGRERCGFMNPEFDPIAKTISTHWSSGAGNIYYEVYKVTNGKIELATTTHVGS